MFYHVVLNLSLSLSIIPNKLMFVMHITRSKLYERACINLPTYSFMIAAIIKADSFTINCLIITFKQIIIFMAMMYDTYIHTYITYIILTQTHRHASCKKTHATLPTYLTSRMTSVDECDNGQHASKQTPYHDATIASCNSHRPARRR